MTLGKVAYYHAGGDVLGSDVSRWHWPWRSSPWPWHKVLGIVLESYFCWVAELRWKLSLHVFLLLHYYSTGARTIYTTLILTQLICCWTKYAACPCSVQPTLSPAGAHFCTPATSAPVEHIFSQSWLMMRNIMRARVTGCLKHLSIWRTMPVSSDFVSVHLQCGLKVISYVTLQA